MPALISVNDIHYQYSNFELILDRINFQVQSGEFLSILGPSGCGKSTLLRLLAGLAQPSGGTIKFNDDQKPNQGFVFQEPRLLPWCNVLENVRLPLDFKKLSKNISNQRAQEAIEKAGLSDSVQKFPSQLSGGMKMRVSIARALVLQPSLLLFDEPFSALDEYTRQIFQNDLRKLWQSSKMTILFVTHSIDEAVYLSTRAIVLSKRPAKIIFDDAIQLAADRVLK